MIEINDIKIGEGFPLAFILGPCVMESEQFTFECASFLKEISPYPFIFKASFDKANRSSIHSFRGIGLEKGLKVLKRIKDELNLSVTTDIHIPEHADLVKEVVDLIQIPAFLCRQTDLIVAAALTNKPLNIKKGQFVAPHDMKQVVLKVGETKNKNLLLTERGFCFGYNNLVCDMRSIPIMKDFKVPVCFDASHSVQLPGGLGTSSSGDRAFIPTLAKSAIAAGADAIFLETHPNPDKAKSDPKSQWPQDTLLPLLHSLYHLHEFVGSHANL